MSNHPLFVDEAINARNHTYPMRISQDELEFLRKEAERRGVNVVTLIRRCLRSELCKMER